MPPSLISWFVGDDHNPLVPTASWGSRGFVINKDIIETVLWTYGDKHIYWAVSIQTIAS